MRRGTTLLLAAISIMGLASVAGAAQIRLTVPFKAHPNNASYACPLPKWLCFNGGHLGVATMADSMAGYGNVNADIQSGKVHLVMHSDMGVVSVKDSLFPVLADYGITPEMAYALGYKSIVLKQGNYTVSIVNSTFGEVSIDATLSGAINPVPAVSPAAVTALSVLLLGAGLVVLRRKRTGALES